MKKKKFITEEEKTTAAEVLRSILDDAISVHVSKKGKNASNGLSYGPAITTPEPDVIANLAVHFLGHSKTRPTPEMIEDATRHSLMLWRAAEKEIWLEPILANASEAGKYSERSGGGKCLDETSHYTFPEAAAAMFPKLDADSARSNLTQLLNNAETRGSAPVLRRAVDYWIGPKTAVQRPSGMVAPSPSGAQWNVLCQINGMHLIYQKKESAKEGIRKRMKNLKTGKEKPLKKKGRK